MEDSQRPTDDSGTECGVCTPADRRTDSDGDTSSGEDHVEPAGVARGNQQGASEGAGMEGAENCDADEGSADEFSDGTDDEGGGIRDMSQLGAGVVAVKFQTVHQQSYQLVGKDTKSFTQHIEGCCQSAQGEIATSPQVLGTAALTPASTNTTCVVPKTTNPGILGPQALTPGSTSAPGVLLKTTSPRVPGTAAPTQAFSSTTCVVPKTTSPQILGTLPLTPESTSSLLPQIPASHVSQVQSSGLPEVPMTGDSTGVTQYNFIQVRQDFGDVTVKGSKNLNIGGTQNIGTTPTNKEEEETPLTLAQKIRKRTASRIQSWTKDMVETDALKKVKEKLDRGATWVTIKGRPGEGKSTTAYMALKDLYNQGRQVYQVESPEEYSDVIMTCKDPVIMLDDILGDMEFDAAEWAKWRPRLRPMVDGKHPDTYAEKDVLNISTKSEKVSERTKVDKTEVKRETIIILVGRDYVLKSSLADLGRMADYISCPQYVVEVSSERASYERRQIWRVHAEAKNIDIEESTVSRICESDCPHGFPHVCKMFVTAYEKDWTPLEIEMFFQAPLDFLGKTLNKHLSDKIKRSLFMAIIKRDGKISGQEMEEEDNFGYEYIAAADDMVGSYLKKEEDTYVFDHPSIYDSVSFILSTKQPKFVIENCSLSFINQRLRLTPSNKEKKEDNVRGETDLIANIPWTYAKLLARRFASEIQRRNLLHVLSHQSLCYSDFVDLLMDCLKTQYHMHMRVSDIVKLTDNLSNRSFCELLSSNKSHYLIKYMIETENISFTQSEGRDILLGVCRVAACCILKYISGHMKLKVNATYGWMKKTPLMLAAETRDSEFVSQMLSLNPDLHARDSRGQTVFHYLCENGLTSAVKHAINMGVEVNQHYGSHCIHSLYSVIRKGHLGVVELLVNKGCDIDNQTGLTYAVSRPNTDMVRYFLDRGAVVDIRAVCHACVVGNRNIVEMLFEKGADVNMTSPDGRSPLLNACQGNPALVSYLLKKGASVNQTSDVTDDTPLHVAAGQGSADCVDVLLKAGAVFNVLNNTGDTPLHVAAGRGSADCIYVLLKAGADVNVQNETCDRPLHAAARRSCRECVDVLVKVGADVNIKNNAGDTPLHAAAAGWVSTECVDVLVKGRADVNVQNNTGYTPLHAAVLWGSPECGDVLVKAGADVNIQNNTGDTPLHAAAARWRSTEYVDVLLKAGAAVNVQNNTGDTPLHEAVAAENFLVLKECVDDLVKAGAAVNVQNNTGDTPLYIAAGRGSRRYVDVLVKAGADVNVQNNAGDTPLHAAAAGWVSTECVDVLVKGRADVNVQNNTGDTPLHATARRISTESDDMFLKAGVAAMCVDVLVKVGADVNVQNNAGDTPFRAAPGRRGSTECVDMSLKAGAAVNVQNNTAYTPIHLAAVRRRLKKYIDVLVKSGADVNVQNNTGDTPLHIAAACEATE